VKAVTGNLSIDSLQKTATFLISHIIWIVLQSESGTMKGGGGLALFKDKYRRNNTRAMRRQQQQQHNNKKKKKIFKL